MIDLSGPLMGQGLFGEVEDLGEEVVTGGGP